MKPAANCVSKQVQRHGPADPVEHLEVLTSGMHHHQEVRPDEARQGRQVQFQGIHQDQATLPCDLDQGDPREIGLLAVELGVNRYALLSCEGSDQIIELRPGPRPGGTSDRAARSGRAPGLGGQAGIHPRRRSPGHVHGIAPLAP